MRHTLKFGDLGTAKVEVGLVSVKFEVVDEDGNDTTGGVFPCRTFKLGEQGEALSLDDPYRAARMLLYRIAGTGSPRSQTSQGMTRPTPEEWPTYGIIEGPADELAAYLDDRKVRVLDRRPGHPDGPCVFGKVAGLSLAPGHVLTLLPGDWSIEAIG